MGIPLHTPVFYIKVEFEGVNFTRTCFPDELTTATSPAEPSVDLDLEYIENVFTYLES